MTKTVGLTDDAYERLKAVKREGETFSDVVRRLTGAHLLKELAGTMDDETAEEYMRAIREGRERAERERKERYERIWGDDEDR